jgi:hypothetical protein
VSGVATFREQEVRFPFDGDAVRANRVVREHQLDVLGGVPFEEWTLPSRCAGWPVHDVVRHVVQMNEVTVGAAARAVVDAGEALDAGQLVGSPAGRQPWARVLLHALFDALVHERDVTEPLGRSTPYAPEHLPVLAYALLLAARAACAYGREFAVRIDVGEQALDVSVQGPAVDVVTVTERDGAVAADPLPLLDGLSGRVPLRDVLAAPDDVRAALGLLARSL